MQLPVKTSLLLLRIDFSACFTGKVIRTNDASFYLALEHTILHYTALATCTGAGLSTKFESILPVRESISVGIIRIIGNLILLYIPRLPHDKYMSFLLYC